MRETAPRIAAELKQTPSSASPRRKHTAEPRTLHAAPVYRHTARLLPSSSELLSFGQVVIEHHGRTSRSGRHSAGRG